MKRATYEDDDGLQHVSLIPSDASPDQAEAGIPQPLPDMNWQKLAEAFPQSLNNALVKMNIVGPLVEEGRVHEVMIQQIAAIFNQHIAAQLVEAENASME